MFEDDDPRRLRLYAKIAALLAIVHAIRFVWLLINPTDENRMDVLFTALPWVLLSAAFFDLAKAKDARLPRMR